MTPLVVLAPLFFLFELWQLVMGERYVGIKQISRAADPRSLGPSEPVSFIWVACLACYALWTVLLLASPLSRIFALGLMAVSGLGYAIRSRCSLSLVLVTLTFEGAIRIGLLLSLAGYAWRHGR